MAKEEDLNASLWALARRGENDSVAMRIITFITLIYLPAAFVSVSLIRIRDPFRFSLQNLHPALDMAITPSSSVIHRSMLLTHSATLHYRPSSAPVSWNTANHQPPPPPTAARQPKHFCKHPPPLSRLREAARAGWKRSAPCLYFGGRRPESSPALPCLAPCSGFSGSEGLTS